MGPLAFFGLVFLFIISVSLIVWPKEMWYIAEGWKYKNVEPSDEAILVERILGVLGIIVVGGMGIALTVLW